MKKLFLALGIGAFSALSTLNAQVVDTTGLDTTIIEAPGMSSPAAPAGGDDGTASPRGVAQENEEVENDESPALKRLREERMKREKIEEKLDDIVAYPLNLETDNLSSFQVLDSIAEYNRFIFTGEDHRVEKFNTTLEMKLMQYLNTKGYKYYLMEAGWVSAWMVNRYILEGDSASEQILSTYYSYNFFQMFKGLKETNDSLPPGKKITAVGLDIERDAPLALRSLLLMLPDEPAPDSLEMFVESLKILSAIHIEQAKEYAENADNDDELFDFGGFSFEFDMDEFEEEEDAPKYFYFNMMRTIRDLTQRFRAKEPEFKAYLGDRYPDFERAIKEMENWLVWIGYEKEELPQSWVYREQYMEGNFREMFKDKPEAKGFGQFGRCHITRITKVGDCGFAFFSSLNKRIITKMPELQNQLSSIGIFYGGLDGQNKNGDNGNIEDLIKLTEKGEANLFMDLNDYGDDLLKTKFSSVIVVKSNRYKENSTKNGDIVYDWETQTDFSFSLDFNYIARSLDFTSLNQFSNFSRNSLQTINVLEFGTTFTIDRLVVNMAYGHIPRIDQTQGDSLFQSVGGFNFRYTYGKDLIRSKAIELTPELGIGFMRMKYTEEKRTGENSLFGTPYYTEFYNPAFLLDGRINFGVIAGIFEFRAFAGYNFDVSKEAWKQNKNLVLDGPKTSYTGFYSGIGVSLRFSDKF